MSANEWTRDDLPRIGAAEVAHDSVVDGVLDTVVHWLNRHHPKPVPYDLGGLMIGGLLTGAESKFKRERDELRAAYRAADSARTWAEAERGEALRLKGEQADRSIRAEYSRDEAVERADRLRDERDDAVHALTEAGRERDEMRPVYDEWVSFSYWAAQRLGCHVDDLDGLTITEIAERVAETRTAPTVTRDQIESALMRSDLTDSGRDLIGRHTDAVWERVSGDDPAVHVVRESDVAAVEVVRSEFGWQADGDPYTWEMPGPLRDIAVMRLAAATQAEAVARAIEAEAAVDPVEAKARDLWILARTNTRRGFGDLTPQTQDDYRRLARHLLAKAEE